VIAAVDAALDVVATADELRAELQEQAWLFRTRLASLGLDTCASSTQIVPLVTGASDAAVALSRALEDAGVLSVAIRPPTVPPGTARLRFSLTALHRDVDLERALAAVQATAAVGA
jgi:8-amino-7-oxononanoate synthase